MNERGWFTLMVRGIGLYLLVTGLAQLFPTLTNFLRQGMSGPRPAGTAAATGAAAGSPQLVFMLWQSLAPVAIMALGLYLFFAGTWIIDKLCREVVDRCRRCGYDLREAPGGICPECGTSLKPPEQPGGKPP
jgi:hypothetical protein